MVRTLSLLAAVVLVMAVTGLGASVGVADDGMAAGTGLSEQTGVEAVAVQGSTIPTDWTDRQSVIQIARNALTTVQTVPDPPVVLAPVAGASRYGDTEPLAHETRSRLFEAVLETPGIHLAALADAVSEPLSTVRYHSRVLLSAGLIDAEKDRGYKRLFPVTADDLDRTVHTALASDAKRSVLRTVARTEPASVTTVARELDRSPSTVCHHLTQLEADGLVVRERDGETVVTRLAPSVRSELTEGG